MAAGFPRATAESFIDSLARSGQQSVDSFLEHRPDFLAVGKRAIAEVLVPCENPAILFARRPDHLYDYIIRALNCPVDQFGRNRLSVITFNYDRSFEFYLAQVLEHKYKLQSEDARELGGAVQVVHVHGQLGTLERRGYSPASQGAEAHAAAEGIKVVHEDVATSPEFNAARLLVQSAERIVFLGFGFLEKNVERLQVERRRSGYQTFGSAYGFTDIEKGYIRERFGNSILLGAPDHGCVEFLRHNVRLADV